MGNQAELLEQEKISRRQFLNRAVAAAATVSIVPRYVLGGPGRTPPSGLITRAVIGTGSMGLGAHVTGYPRTLAVCDVDKNRLAGAVKKAGGEVAAYKDFRRVLDRRDIDTVHVPTPPHWHALVSIAAAQAGKDVYSEKPMSKTIREGRAVVETVKRYGRVYSINCRARSAYHQRLRRLVASGALGSPLTVRLYVSAVSACYGRTDLTPQPVPPELDYDMWLGPAPYKPYNRARVGFVHRGYWDYGGGGLTDRGQHVWDPIQYALGKERTGPVEVEADAPWPQHPDAAGPWGMIKAKYEDGTTVMLSSRAWGEDVPLIEGPKGKVLRGGQDHGDGGGISRALKTDPPELSHGLQAYRPPRLVDFAEAVRSRSETSRHPDPEAAHRSCSVLHLGNIAIRLGRGLKWDPVAEKVIGDEAANRLVDVPMRAPWHL